MENRREREEEVDEEKRKNERRKVGRSGKKERTREK